MKNSQNNNIILVFSSMYLGSVYPTNRTLDTLFRNWLLDTYGEQNNKKSQKLTEQGFFLNLFSSRHFQNVWNSEQNFGYYLVIYDNFDWHHLHHRTLAYHYKQDRTKISIQRQK